MKPVAPANASAEGAEGYAFEGYRLSKLKIALFVIASILTGGILAIVALYFPRLRLKFTALRAPLNAAPIVVATGGDKVEKYHVCPVRHVSLPDRDEPQRLMEVAHVRYTWEAASGSFLPLPPLPLEHAHQVTKLAMGASAGGRDLRPGWMYGTEDAYKERMLREQLYGPNEISVDPPNAALIFSLNLLHPLNTIQYVALVVWTIEKYLLYCGVIFFVTVASIVLNTVEEYNERKRIALLAKHHGKVLRSTLSGEFEVVPANRLVPGDLILIRSGEIMPCDAALLVGTAVMDESLLTGESIPVPKTRVAADMDLNLGVPAACMLMGGTRAVLADGATEGLRVNEALVPTGAALAVVCETGFATAKGRLVAGILQPVARLHLDTLRQSLLFIAAMGIIAMVLFIVNVIHLAPLGLAPGDFAFMGFDLLTAACPPALPATLAIATAVAVRRLAAKDIHVTSAQSIALAGLPTNAALDKTGTLTTLGLRFRAALPSDRLRDGGGVVSDSSPPDGDIAVVLATCHGLAPLPDGGVVGDPIEAELAAATGWSLSLQRGGGGVLLASPPSSGAPRPAARLRSIPFDPEKARSGALIRRADGSMLYAAKGAPEAIAPLCDPSSLPQGWQATLDTYTHDGFRVLALAGREVQGMSEPEALSLGQDAYEAGISFLGLVLLDNPLKPCSRDAVIALQAARMRVSMITGDHSRTAIKIARDTNIAPGGMQLVLLDMDEDNAGKEAERVTFLQTSDTGRGDKSLDRFQAMRSVAEGHAKIAISGRCLAALRRIGDTTLLDLVLAHGVVYARMRPAQKEWIVQGMAGGQDGEVAPVEGDHVIFCGDGTNDMLALKAALVGLSLCEAEASVAAPMTARTGSVGAVVTVLAEGRAALVTSHVLFQYVMSYAFIQTLCMVLLGSMGGRYFTDVQFLIADLGFATALGAAMAATRARATPGARRPTPTLLCAAIILPVVAQFAVVAAFQGAAMALLHSQPFYKAEPPIGTTIEERQTPSSDTMLLFLVQVLQLVIQALVVNTGPSTEFRRALVTNPWLCATLAGEVGVLVALFVAPASAFGNLCGMVDSPADFRWRLAALMVLGNWPAAQAVDALVQYVLPWFQRRGW